MISAATSMTIITRDVELVQAPCAVLLARVPPRHCLLPPPERPHVPVGQLWLWESSRDTGFACVLSVVVVEEEDGDCHLEGPERSSAICLLLLH